jgi:hypothetical protein
MNTWTWAALGAVAICLLLLVWVKQRQAPQASGRHRSRAPRQRTDGLDTVAAWEPNATRILSNQERLAYALLVKALPDHMVLAQVPLSRFLRVPTRYSYAEWVKRVGSLSADLVVCDRSSEAIAVVEVRPARESSRSRQRHERMARVLRAAKIRLLVWSEGDLPTPSSVRDQIVARSGADAAGADTPADDPRLGATPPNALALSGFDDTRPGDFDLQREPPPSTWFDDFDTQPIVPRH